MCIFCLELCLCTNYGQGDRGPQKPVEGTRITYGITYGCELHVGAGNQTQILYKNNIILVLSHFSSPNEEQLHDGQKRVFFIFQKGGFFPTILYTS